MSWTTYIRDVNWNGYRLLSVFIITVGLFGIARYWFFPFSSELVNNPVYLNDQRLSSSSAFDQLTTSFPINHAIVIGFTVLIVLFAIHYLSILRKLSSLAPVHVALATLFFAGAILFGLLVGVSLLRVNEFVFQSASATEREVEWLRNGIGFLIQIHLIYVFGWLLCTGLGLTCIGAASRRLTTTMTRRFALIQLLSGLLMVGSVIARLWLPYFGETAPTYAVFISRLEIPMSFGLITSGALSWILNPDNRHNGN
jgi:hypothetical protein